MSDTPEVQPFDAPAKYGVMETRVRELEEGLAALKEKYGTLLLIVSGLHQHAQLSKISEDLEPIVTHLLVEDELEVDDEKKPTE